MADVTAPAQRVMASAGALGVVVKMFAAAAAYVGAVIAARILGADEFGLYTLSLTTVTMLSFLTSGGIEHTLVRLMPIRRAESRERGIRTLSLAAQNMLVGATLVATLCTIFSDEVARLLGQPGASRTLSIMVWGLPFIGLISGLGAANRAVYAFRAALAPAFVIRPLLSGLALAAILAWNLGGERAVAWSFTAAAAAAAAIATALTSVRPEFGAAWMRPRAELDREAIGLSRTYLTINLISNLKMSGLVFIIGLWLTTRDLALFGAASRTAALTVLVLSAVNITFAPIISNLWARGARDELIATYRDTTRWTLAVSAPTCLLLIVCAPGILRLFGPEFVAAAPALAWLTLGQLVNAAVGSVGMILMMTGRQRLMMWDTAGQMLLAMAASVVVAPMFGFVGVAVVSGLANALVNLVMLLQVRGQLGVFPYDGRSLSVVFAILTSAAAGWLAVTIPGMARLDWIVAMCIQAAVVLAVYLSIVLSAGLSQGERRALWRIVRSGRLRAR